MTLLGVVRGVARQYPWQSLLALALLQLASACPELQLPTGGDPTTITAPTNLTATAFSATQINLAWTDNSNNETGFHVERAPGGTTSFSAIATVNAGVTTHQNAGLTASTQYDYRVRAFNTAGNSAYTATATATTLGGSSPPAAPSGLGATTASSTQINLSWTDNSANEDGFRIEQCSGASCSVFAEITTVAAGVTTYQNTGLAASTQYTYRVRAYNGAGNSSYSATATATTTAAPGTPPAAPGNLQTVPVDATHLSLTWNDNSSDEDGFKVERCQGAACSTFAEIGTVGAGTGIYNDQGLTALTSYSYRVRAYNAAGNSGYSNTATGVTTDNPPGAPGGLIATPVSPTQIDLTWSDLSSNETGFQVDRAPGGTQDFVLVALLGANITTYQNTGLTAATSYTFRVRAYNAGGYSGSIEVTASTQAAGVVPAAPSGLAAAAASSAQINLTWTDNSNNEDGFKVERCEGVSCSTFAEIAMVGAGVDNYQSTELTEGTTYGFRVRAYNGAGNSTYSNTASVATETPIPTLPGNLVATSASTSQINLTWDDWSTNETGFKIERCTGAACSNFAEITTVGAGVVSYQNTALAASTLYRYRVRAYNLGGNSLYSNEAEATTQAASAPPNAPSNLTATASTTVSSVIALAWTDNSSNETGFRIEQSVSGGAYTEVGTVTLNTQAVNITGLSGATSYSFRVRAYNGDGNSGYTNTAGATTLASQINVLPSHDNLMIDASVDGVTTSEGNTVYQSGEAAVGCNSIIGMTSALYCTQTAFLFNGLQAQVAGRTIVSATFRLYPYDLAGDFNTTHAINAIAAAWNPATLTWNNHPASYTTYQVNRAPPQDGNPVDYDVTSIVQAWASGTWVNNGLMLREHPGPSPALGAVRVTIFNGLDINAGAIYRPQLIITLQ